MCRSIFRIWFRKLKEDGFAYESEGALVVDVTEETDKKNT